MNEYGGTAAFRLTTMLNHENQRHAQRIIAALMGNKRTRGVAIEQFKLNPNVKECISTSSKDVIEQEWAKENEAKFCQTENT